MRSCVQFTATMDAKDLRTESALSERNNDGSKYSQSGGIAIHCDRNKSYQDIGSNSLAKVDVQSARPCAVIGPDRVVPPPPTSDAYLKKGPVEPWPCMDNGYHTRRPPEYPHKLANFQNPTRNISPRQTFQENMQRIMVPPSYNSVKISDDTNYVQMSDRSNALHKNVKINVPPEAKFCDVPYTVYPNSNEQKNVRLPEMCIPSVNPTHSRTAPHGWPAGSVNIRPTRTYGAPELYQYPDYSSCAGPRPVVPRPNRTVPEESGYVYADPFYHQEGNVRFKPYPTVKDRFPQQRYEYIGNYPNSFHPPPTFPSHKYELPKNVPPHPYPPYPPIKYMDRVPEPVMEGYQRNQQGSYNPYRNQIIHPNYGPVLGNCPPNKIHSYPPDAHIKTVPPNKLPYDNSKAYIEYENGRPKMYPSSEGYLVNEMGKMHPIKSQVIIPNYPNLNMHNIPPNPYFKKDNQQMKNYEYIHFRNMDPNLNIHNPMVRHTPVFSPNTSAISPTDSSTSNDTSQTLGASQEDCGYVSQSSTASVRSMDSGINRIPNDCFRKYYDSRFGPIIRTAPMSKSELNSNNNSKEKKNLDVRQFLQMWNEGDEETEDHHPKDKIVQIGPKSDNTFGKSHEIINQQNHEQLYVLGLVNVPSEELGKYEHIQKVSKLPENIKGYNHIELLNQFEEAIEFSNMTNYKTSTPKEYQMTSKAIQPKQTPSIIPSRPLSPLDVEAKISQSVIHKEVGCNFEIKPCSPKMLNVEVATPIQNILVERSIEKVANPVMLKSPRINNIDENIDCNVMKRKDHRMNINNDAVRIPSCKMVNAQFSSNNIDSIKNSYSLQDLESNSGLCLASLPRLDNDIELNFPEVNQQFINANKGESSVSNSLRDLPSLELLENSNSLSKDKINDINTINQTNDPVKSPCIVDSEKEFSKLSKYRKSKIHSSDSKDQSHHVINAARTDSVIIKNPENRNYEEKSIFSPSCLNKQVGDIQQVPINLTSQGCLAESPENTSAIIKPKCASEEKDTPIDIAIDFSLNKNCYNENVGCTEQNDKEPEIFTHNNIETNHSMLENDLNTLPFSNGSPNNQDTVTDHNKIAVNFATSPVIYDSTDTVPEITSSENFKEDISLLKNPPLGEILLKNECLSSLPAVKEKEDEDGNEKSNKTNDINSNSLLPIEFETPAEELLCKADCNSNNYLMDIDKDCDSVGDNLNNKDDSIMENTLEGDIRNADKINLKDVVNDVKGNLLAEDTIISKVVDSQLNNDELTDNNFSQMHDLPMTENEDQCCNNLDFTIDEKLNNKLQTEDSQETSDLIFDLPSSNNIITQHMQDDRRDNANDEYKINLHSPDDNTMSRSPNNQSVDSKNNTSLPDDNARLSPKDGEWHTIQQKNNHNLLSLSNITHSQEAGQKETEQQKTDFNLASPNNLLSSSTNDPQFEVTEGSPSDFYSPSPNIISINRSNVDLSYQTSKRENTPLSDISHTILANNDVTNHNNTIVSIKEVSECQLDLPSTEGRSSNEILPQNDINTRASLEFPILERKDKFIKMSKKMYSPWIQNLIMFCEGNIKNVHFNKDDHVSNNWSMTDIEKIGIDNELCFEEENNITHNNLNNKNDIVSSTIQSNSETTKLSDSTTTDECSTVAVNDGHATKYNDSKDQECSMDEINHLNDPNWHQENNNLNAFIECAQGLADMHNNGTSPKLPVFDKLEKLCNKSDTVPKTSENDSCLSPDVNEQWDKQSNCSDNINKQLDEQHVNNDEVLKSWDKGSYSNAEVLKQSDKQSICTDKNSELWDKQSYISDEVPEEWDRQSSCNDDVTEKWDRQSNCNDEAIEEFDRQSNCNDEATEEWDGQYNCNDEATEWDKKSDCSNDAFEKWNQQINCNSESLVQSDKQYNCSPDKPDNWDIQNICHDEVPEQWDKPPNYNEENLEQLAGQSSNKHLEEESETIIENHEKSTTKTQPNEHAFFNKKRQPLKRSLSESALNIYSNNENAQQEKEENVQFIWPFKRRKINNIHNDILAQNLCNIIQSNRRNSISAMYNEENVSFCILIDNGCIIAEEENDEQEKICYTELSEECIEEIQNDCTKEEEVNFETVTEVMSTPQEENDCEYSDSFVMQDEDEKLEEAWVEDVACVETVISDDIAEDIEISGPSSPKDDLLSDNDESGVFSSSEHTDKVKYIYGDKMCNDDAQFVETLYNTPQMDVTKTLIQRESLISGEYYDNDSLEKILSESNEPELSPYVPEYTEPVYSPGIMDVKETVGNKENMDIEANSPLQSKGNPLLDAGIDKIDAEDVKLGQLFDGTQDDTVHSCESSVDNVFSYKENDENTNYTTSSSPEVSSTTSEEKSSGILLKITNYQGSRISQINEITQDSKRPSCKFTEDKDYVQSHSNFPTHRPLLTKAAQKYIPPLKESMRDLKVKLSLPQHSLMKLKQLKISKDKPKLSKPNITVPKITKKPKPKFEDVLKSIDEIQIKMHKEKTKKSKKSIPKVVIKKNENGSHYASTSNKDEFNPDLTGRKWQPWVFIEKNHFIDKMAIRRKTKAVYSHRKRTYVLAEKFRKYKSANSAKFVISPPISDCPSTGLKYTIRLKHNY